MPAATAVGMVRATLLAVWLCGVSGCFYTETSPLPSDFATCAAAAEPPAAGVAAPTWYRDVEPIVVEKCQGCHVDGGIGPFPIGYEEMVALRDEIADAVQSKAMPPWQPAPCCAHYKRDRSLSDAEIATIETWIASGEQAGDPADEQPVTPPSLTLPRVDLHAEMRAAFAPMPVLGTNELRCFILDAPEVDRDRFVTGFQFNPGQRAEVHHVIAFAVTPDAAGELEKKDGADGKPGWECAGEAAELQGGRDYIGGWQPGDLARVLPDGVGRTLPAHAKIYLQIHYDAAHGTLPDDSSIDLMLADHVERIEQGVPVGNPAWFIGDGLEIDAGDPDATVWFAYDPTILTNGTPIELANVMLHMHEHGSKGKVAVLHPDGTATCVLDIDQWDFHWLSDYDLADPIRVEPGDQVYVECHWDNSGPGAKTMHWGTDQEMCGAVLTYSEAL